MDTLIFFFNILNDKEQRGRIDQWLRRHSCYALLIFPLIFSVCSVFFYCFSGTINSIMKDFFNTVPSWLLWLTALSWIAFFLRLAFTMKDFLKLRREELKREKQDKAFFERLLSLSKSTQSQLLYIYERLKTQHSLPMPFNSPVIQELCDGNFIKRFGHREIIVGMDTRCHDYAINREVSDFISSHYDKLQEAEWGNAPVPVYAGV